MFYFILILFGIIIIEALVIAILIIILRHKNNKLIDEYNKTLIKKTKDIEALNSEISVKKEESNEKIDKAVNLDDIKRIFTKL